MKISKEGLLNPNGHVTWVTSLCGVYLKLILQVNCTNTQK